MVLFFKKEHAFFLSLTFILLCSFASATLPNWDLTASFVAARLLGSGEAKGIYYQLHETPGPRADQLWVTTAQEGGIQDGQTTPYVQTPLWAWLVAPLARAVDFRVFAQVFAALMSACMAGVVALGARRWAPSCAGALPQAMLLAGLLPTVPFLQSLVQGQTHVLFVLISLLAILAGLSGREVAAGALLALAACVKISPLWLAVAWAVAGRWRAVASFVVCSAGLAGLAVLAVGPDLFADYLAQLKAYGRGITLTFNNDSLATVLLSGQLSEAAAFRQQTLPLPAWVTLASLVCLVSSAIAGGVMERRHAGGASAGLGGVFVLVGATAFTPLAWNHYYIVLILPVMVFLQAWREGRGRGWLALALLVWALDLWPIAYTVGAPLSAVARRSEFWAALLCLAGLLRVLEIGKKEPENFHGRVASRLTGVAAAFF